MSDKIKAHHLERKAILYVRQSSTYQVSNNLESQKLQYAMQQRLQHLGWLEIDIVDDDLGRSAAGTVTRAGFERMVAEICLGQVGTVAAREVSRFARNSREWQRLVEVCRVVDTLLIDQETVYTPRQSNDRLLLGLKGSLNEYELDLLRQRSVEARREKARRGELIVAAPAGYIKTPDQRLEKDPDHRIQQALQLVFAKFMELGTARQVLLWLLEHGLELPVVNQRGEPHWIRPTYSTVHQILSNPTYAGAYAYGKTEHSVRYENGEPRRSSRLKDREHWWALIPNAHEGYISLEQHEHIQQMMSDNCYGREQVGAPKEGAALLAGILRCRRCGRKLMVRYTGNRAHVLRYACYRAWLDNGEPPCIGFGGLPVDEAIAREIVRVVQPAAIEAAVMAAEEQSQQDDQVLQAWEREREAARYAAHRAQKQYDLTDPENRLVADELERRWNEALRRLQDVELRIDQHNRQQTALVRPTKEQFEHLASDLETVWNSPATDVRLKKRIARTLIHEVIADVDPDQGVLILVIHWKGGIHTELHVRRRRRGQNRAQTPKDVVEAVRMLARVCSDEMIAGVLTRNGLRTGRGNRWTKERVTALRSYNEIPRHTAERQKADGWMNLTQAADFLDTNSTTLRIAFERGEIQTEHPFASGPWIVNRSALQTKSATRLAARCQGWEDTPATPIEDQAVLDLSDT
ncbi:MAG: recombinase family protein [Bryobacteraceae bacterium]